MVLRAALLEQPVGRKASASSSDPGHLLCWQVWVADSFEGIPMPRTAAGQQLDETQVVITLLELDIQQALDCCVGCSLGKSVMKPLLIWSRAHCAGICAASFCSS